ncbi:MAG: hypothetical protein ACRD4T_12575, partial [Candidatus Acidiferrales bacterium]
VLDPLDKGCEERILAFTSIRLRGGEISSGKIVFCTAGAARDGTVVHEVGHTFGLRHCDDWSCVMASTHAVERLDVKSAEFCRSCRLQIAAARRHPRQEPARRGI